MSSCRAIDIAARRFGTLADQMSSGGIDPRRALAARQRLAAVASLLPPRDRELLSVVSTPDQDGELPTPSTIARRLGTRRQNAARTRARLFRRIRRLTTTPPLPVLPPVDELAEHMADEGADPVCAYRLALVLHYPRREAAAREGISPRRLRVCARHAVEHLRPGCPTCDAVAAHRAARAGSSPG